MLLSILPFQIRKAPEDSTFCSRYVAEALKSTGLECVQGLNASIVSPNKLYNVLKEGTVDREVAGSVEHKMKKLQSQECIPMLSMAHGRGASYAKL